MIKYDRRKIEKWWNHKKIYWIKKIAIKMAKTKLVRFKKLEEDEKKHFSFIILFK